MRRVLCADIRIQISFVYMVSPLDGCVHLFFACYKNVIKREENLEKHLRSEIILASEYINNGRTLTTSKNEISHVQKWLLDFSDDLPVFSQRICSHRSVNVEIVSTNEVKRREGGLEEGMAAKTR